METSIAVMLLILIFTCLDRKCLINTIFLISYIELASRCIFGFWISSVLINQPVACRQLSQFWDVD